MNPGLLHCRQIIYHLSQRELLEKNESQIMLERILELRLREVIWFSQVTQLVKAVLAPVLFPCTPRLNLSSSFMAHIRTTIQWIVVLVFIQAP